MGQVDCVEVGKWGSKVVGKNSEAMIKFSSGLVRK
jgi:hypothetical protein